MTDVSKPALCAPAGTCSLVLAVDVGVGIGIEPTTAQDLDDSPVGLYAAADAPRSFSSRSPQFEAMAQAQAPDRSFITCSDSRLVPSEITATRVGDLFVIRNARNIVPPHDAGLEGVTATIEYAVDVLEVPTIVVCGHTRCGAMKAALDPTGLETVPNIRNWIQFAEPAKLAVDELHPHVGPLTRWVELVKQNGLQQIANLKTNHWVAARTATGRLRLEGWIRVRESATAQPFTAMSSLVEPSVSRRGNTSAVR